MNLAEKRVVDSIKAAGIVCFSVTIGDNVLKGFSKAKTIAGSPHPDFRRYIDGYN